MFKSTNDKNLLNEWFDFVDTNQILAEFQKNVLDANRLKQLLVKSNISNWRYEDRAAILEIACQHPLITLEIMQLLLENIALIPRNKARQQNQLQYENDLEDIKKRKHHYIAGDLAVAGPIHKKRKIEFEADNLANYGSTNQYHPTLLHIMCETNTSLSDHLDIVKYLVETKRINPDWLDDLGQTTLHCACGNPSVNLEIIQYLVEKGADPTRKNNYNQTLLHEYITMNQAKLDCRIIEYLIGKGTDINAICNNNSSALNIVCDSEPGVIPLEIIYYITENTANLMVEDEDGYLPIELACQRNNKFAVIILLFLFFQAKRNIGLEDFEISSDETINEEIKKWVSAAQNSKAEFLNLLSKELKEDKKLQIFLYRHRRLPMELLPQLKAYGFFSQENYEIFPSQIQNKVKTFVMCMKNINANRCSDQREKKHNNLKLNFLIPKPVINLIIAEIAMNESAATQSKDF